MESTEPTKMNSIIAVYDAETSVDQSIPIRRRLETLGNIVVTDDNVEEAKAVRTSLAALLEDAKSPRMRVQRAIKAHPIGQWAFTPTQLEKDIKNKSDHIKLEIDAHTKTKETLSIMNDKEVVWFVEITTNLKNINSICKDLTDRGIPAMHVGFRGIGQDNNKEINQ